MERRGAGTGRIQTFRSGVEVNGVRGTVPGSPKEAGSDELQTGRVVSKR